MANLGSLWYDLRIHDLTAEDLQAIEKKLKNLGIELDTKKLTESLKKSVESYNGKDLTLGVKTQFLHDAIRSALKQQEFPIKVTVNKAEAQEAVREALQRAGLQRSFNADDKRFYDAETRRMAAMQVATAKAGAQNALAQQRLARAHRNADVAARSHTSASINLGSAMRGNIRIAGELGPMLASAYSIVALKNFMTKVVEIGGELEQQKLAMKAILGDGGLANTITSQINSLAIKSPFGVMELNQYAKQLTAFQIPYNELYDTMKRLADISAATSVDMGRIILAYGQIKAATVLKGTEARQLTEANIPIFEMLSNYYTKLEGQMVTVGEVMDRMSKKQIPFKDVKNVLWELTDAGGKFYNMQEVLSESVKAKWKNLADALDLMFADIAESTSSSLKSLAEILTELTRNWGAIASVVTSGAIAFGLAKTASLLTARSLDASGTSALKAAANAALLERQNARLAQGYRMLTDNEREALQTSLPITSLRNRQKALLASLSEAQFRQLALTGQITKEEWSRMIALGRLNDVQKKILVQTGVLTQAELNNIQTLKGWKKWTLGVGNAMRSLGRSMLALVANPMTLIMAAAGAVTALWQHLSEQSEKAEEFGNALSTKATDGAKSLTEALKNLNGEFSKLSETQLHGAIEKMEQAIKDYGINAEKVLFYSRVDENGVERTLEQRAEYLYEQAKTLENAYAKFRDWKMGDMGARAMESTNGNFWTLHWYEGLQSDIDDYVKDVRNAQKELTNYLRDHEDEAKLVVKFAADIDPEFKNLTEGMGIEQAMNALVADIDRLQNVYDRIPRKRGRLVLDGTDMYRFGNLSNQFHNNGTNTDVKHSMDEVLREEDLFIASLKKEILAKDKDFFKNLTDEKKVMLGIAFQEAFRGMEGLDDQYIMPFVDRWNKAMGTAFDPQFIEGQIQSQFSSLIPDLGEELAKKVLNGEQLEKAEEDKVKALFDTAVAHVKNAWPGKAAEIQKIVDSNPVYANIILAFNMRSGMNKWQKELDDAFGNNRDITAKIKAELDTQSTLKTLAELKKSAKTELDKFALTFNISPNFGKLEKLSTNGPLTMFEKQQREEFNKLVDLWNDIAKGEKATGINLDDWSTTNGKGGTPKDEFAEALKQRLDTLKKAYSEYKKELAVMNKDAALERIKSAGIFDELFSGENAITNFDSYKSTLAKLLEDAEAAFKGVSENDSRFKGRHDLVISLRTLLNLEIPRDETKDALDKAKREIDSLVSETTKKWDLFKQLYETTGDRQWSMDAAFGDNMYFDEAATELVKTLNKRIEDKGLTINVPFEITEDKAKELFGNENEDLFNLWKTIRERASKDGVDAWKAEAKAMQEYIREYGTFQQRRLAIEKDYAAKIADARAKGNVTEARLLENQRDTAKQNLEVEAIKQSIDWGSVFSSFGTMFKEQLGPTIENLRAITKTADFKNSGVQNQQTLYELINKLEEANTSWDSDIFATLGKDLEAYQTAMLNYIDAQNKERIATEELTAAKERLAEAEASGNSTAIAAATRSVTVATDKLNTASEKVRSFGANVQDATSNLKTSATTANNMFNTLASSLAGFKSGSLQGVGDSLMNLDKLFNNSGVTNAVGSALSKGMSKLLGNSEIANSVGAALGNSGLIGPIISAILSILDTLKDGIGVLVSDLLDTILGAVAGILKNLFNGKMFVQIGNAIKDGIAGILDAITLGGFSSWFDTSNAKKVKETIDRLTERNESLQTAIEDLRDTIKKYSSTKAIIDTNEAIQLQKEREKNFLDIAKTQAGYHGNHHSWDYYWNGFSEEQIAKFSKQIGRAWDGNIWGLSPEEMKLLRSNVEMWESIRNSGKGGYGGDLVDKLDDYIEQAGVIEELTAELYQTLTGMSFDTMYNGFLDTLMKMDSTAADFADNISEYFFKAMLSKKIGDLFGNQLEDWYKKFGEAVASDTISDAEVRNKLTDEYMGIIDEALKWRDQFAQATGYTGESTSKSGMSAGIQGVTESTADLLASYINGIRGDVSLQANVHWPRLLDEVFPQMNVIAESQLRVQNQIAENTLRNAVAAEAIVKSNDEISKLLNRVAMGSAKFYVN